MAFNVKSKSKESANRVNIDLEKVKAVNKNARVVTDTFISFTLSCEGFSLYNMRLVEFKDGKQAILPPQEKRGDKYYNLYAIYLSDADEEWLKTNVCTAAEMGEDIAYAKFLAEKNGTLSAVFDMGKYNEYAPMLNIVCAQKDVEGTYQVVEQLLESVDSLYGFSKSKLYRHKKFKDTDGSYLQVIKEKLLESFRNEKDLSFMKGYEPWEKLIYK